MIAVRNGVPSFVNSAALCMSHHHSLCIPNTNMLWVQLSRMYSSVVAIQEWNGAHTFTSPSHVQVYITGCSRPAANQALLEDLVQARHELARLLGSPSHVHHQLAGYSLAQTPAAVQHFLEQLSAALLPMARPLT